MPNIEFSRMRCRVLLLRLVGFPFLPRPTIVYPTANVHAAKKAVKDNSVEKDIAQFIKKEVSSPVPPPFWQLLWLQSADAAGKIVR